VVECIRLESEQTVKGLGSSNLPLSSTIACMCASVALVLMPTSARADLYTTLGGTIVDAAGAPIAGAQIGVAVPEDVTNYALPVATSRRDGSFSLIGIRESDVVVEVQGAGYVTNVCRYRLAPGGTLRLTFRLTRLGEAAQPAVPVCPRPPVGGGQTQDVYIIR